MFFSYWCRTDQTIGTSPTRADCFMKFVNQVTQKCTNHIAGRVFLKLFDQNVLPENYESQPCADAPKGDPRMD